MTKAQVELAHSWRKSKVLKHICALSNSNPANNSYIVSASKINEIVGVDFFDDIQNLVNAYLENPPKIQYESPFPNLPKDRVIGLVTVKPKNNTSYFKKGHY
jgi:hypothetical protein